MAFAHTAQRKYEALRPFGQIGLFGMRYNAGVEQGRRFVGIFMTKMGANEEGLFVTGLTFAEFDSVRRQNIWRSARRKLAECGPRLEVDVRRRACGVASADIRWSVA